MFEFIPNQKINFPWLCISKPKGNVVITTKKIASRFFEDVSRGPRTKEHQDNRKISIDLRFENISKLDNNTYDKKIIFDDKLIFETGDSTVLLLDEFYKIFDITNLNDMFSIEYFKNNKIYIATRNPYDRFYTGFFENTDHIAFDEYQQQHLKFEPQHIIDSILNKYIQKVDYSMLSDEHTSLWNTFIYEILSNHNLLEFVTVVDLEESDKLQSIFGIIPQPSNKKYLNAWLSNPNNKIYIDEVETKLKYYFDLEMQNYNKLLELR